MERTNKGLASVTSLLYPSEKGERSLLTIAIETSYKLRIVWQFKVWNWLFFPEENLRASLQTQCRKDDIKGTTVTKKKKFPACVRLYVPKLLLLKKKKRSKGHGDIFFLTCSHLAGGLDSSYLFLVTSLISLICNNSIGFWFSKWELHLYATYLCHNQPCYTDGI